MLHKTALKPSSICKSASFITTCDNWTGSIAILSSKSMWECGNVDSTCVLHRHYELPGVPKKNYTLFDFMQCKTYKSYFNKIKIGTRSVHVGSHKKINELSWLFQSLRHYFKYIFYHYVCPTCKFTYSGIRLFLMLSAPPGKISAMVHCEC